MKDNIVLKQWSWLLVMAVGLALGLAACETKEEQPSKSQTTNTSQPTKAPEHPEHPK